MGVIRHRHLWDGLGDKCVLAPSLGWKCALPSPLSSAVIFYLTMGFPPCPPPLCISGIRSSPAEEQLLGGPSLISCLISLMNNVPLPVAAAWPEARPWEEGGC